MSVEVKTRPDLLVITPSPLQVEPITQLISHPSCGAISIFLGTTRADPSPHSHSPNHVVKYLEYEAYEPMALKQMKSICDEIRKKWPQVHGIAIYHRVGIVHVQEASVVIGISSPHRQVSLEALTVAIDTLKKCVPIWKKEIYSDDTTEWKENVECPWRSIST